MRGAGTANLAPHKRLAFREFSVARANTLWARLQTPAGNVAMLILTTLSIRLVFASSLGLGIDESYMVAGGRSIHLSYFDHPPLSWWMAWAAARLLGTEAPVAVRLPFVLTFALTTWLMFRLTSKLFNARAGLWAAVLLNAAPVFGVTAASWVLPDGPLFAALLGATICFVEALSDRRLSAQWRWWTATGVCTGIALLSKYSAGLTIIGAAVFLLTQAAGRRWLARPQPYVAGLLALAMFAPVLLWNARHDWVSLLFQGGRAAPVRLHLFGPLTTLGGEALFLLPWIWLPLVVCGLAAARLGSRNWRSWLLVCLAAPPILLFLVVSFWSHVLFHWAAPGYLMLFPLLGDVVARHLRGSRTLRRCLAVTAVFVTVGVMFVTSEVRFDWLHYVETFAPGADPDLAAVDWTSLRDDLAARGLLGRPGLIVATTRWFDAGKVDYALGGRVAVICLGDDPRQYGLNTKNQDYNGDDVLIVSPHLSLAQFKSGFGDLFEDVEEIRPSLLLHGGRPTMPLNLYLGHRFHADPLTSAGAGHTIPSAIVQPKPVQELAAIGLRQLAHLRLDRVVLRIT